MSCAVPEGGPISTFHIIGKAEVIPGCLPRKSIAAARQFTPVAAVAVRYAKILLRQIVAKENHNATRKPCNSAS
jgi:hypothetical protein